MMSWLSSNTLTIERRERIIITVAGISPDVDGLGIIIDLIVRPFGVVTNYGGDLHHQLHSLAFCLFVTAISYFLSRTRKVITAVSCFLIFHLHLLCDFIGSKGPDGYQWPIPYLSPFSFETQLTWQHQWELNAWPNMAISIVLLAFIFMIAFMKERSPFEILSERLDRVFIRMIKKDRQTE